MIPVPLKTTDKTDLSKCLITLIGRSFSPDVVAQHTPAAEGLNALREEVRQAVDRSMHTLELHQRYYAVLCSLGKRFPFGESSDDSSIQFVWYGAFNKRRTAQADLRFEMAAILFNIGALYSHIAASQALSTDEGTKAACHYFQVAAGAYEKLKTLLQEHSSLIASSDFNVDIITLVENLMLAQAQECFLTQAIRGKVSPSLVSKLASQAAEFYAASHGVLSMPGMQGATDKTWTSHLSAKIAMMRAQAHLCAADQANKEDQYGLEVARRKAASGLLHASGMEKSIRGLSSELQRAFSTIQGTADRSLAVAERDNNTIYHMIVPATLGALPLKAMVKAKELPPMELPGGVDPFHSLIPFEVLQSLSVYSEMKAEMLRREVKHIQDHNDLARSSLRSMNLPAALEEDQSSGALPPDISKCATEICHRGGAHAMDERLSMIRDLAMEDARLVDDSQALLDQEEADDAAARHEFRDSWKSPPSPSLTTELYADAAKFRSNLEQAAKSDAIVREKYENARGYIVLLSGPTDELQRRIPCPAKPTPAADKPKSHLLEALGRLDDCFTERQTLESQLKEMVEKDDIRDQLVNTEVSAHEEVHEKEMAKFEDVKARLAANFEYQDRLMGAISEHYSHFMALTSDAEGVQHRADFLKNLLNAHSNFLELQGHLEEGIKFYTAFQDHLISYRERVQKFVDKRTKERSRHLDQLRASAATYAALGSVHPDASSGWSEAPPHSFSSSTRMEGYAPTSAFSHAAGRGGGPAREYYAPPPPPPSSGTATSVFPAGALPPGVVPAHMYLPSTGDYAHPTASHPPPMYEEHLAGHMGHLRVMGDPPSQFGRNTEPRYAATGQQSMPPSFPTAPSRRPGN